MSILVIDSTGAGATIGVQLARAGHGVTYLDDRRRAAQMDFAPLVVRSDVLEFTGYADHIEAAEIFGPASIIIAATDAWKVAKLTTVLPRAVGPATQVLAISEGIEQGDLIREACSAAHCVHGLHEICAQTDEHGTIIHSGVCGDRIVIEATNPVEAATAKSIATLFENTDLEVSIAQCIDQPLWTRMLATVSIGGMGALASTNLDAVGRVDSDYAQVWALILECAEVASATGVRIDIPELSAVMQRLPAATPLHVKSLLNRIDRGDLREVGELVAQMHRAARTNNVSTPVLDLVYTALAARATSSVDDDAIEVLKPQPTPAPRYSASGWYSRLRADRQRARR